MIRVVRLVLVVVGGYAMLVAAVSGGRPEADATMRDHFVGLSATVVWTACLVSWCILTAASSRVREQPVKREERRPA